MKALLPIFVVAALCQLGAGFVVAQDLDSAPPVVVKTVPEAGTKGVASGLVEIRVTFSKPMAETSWSWVSPGKEFAAVEIVGKPHYEADHKTCVVQVKLEPGKTYGIWVNTDKFQNFQDTKGHAAVPYLLVFQTREK